MIDFSTLPLTGYGFTAAAIIASIILADIVITVLDKVFHGLTSKTQTKLDDMLFEASRGPTKLLFVVLGIYLSALYFLGAPSLWGYDWDFFLLVSMILVAGNFVASLLNAFLRWSIIEKGYRKGKTAFFPMFRKIILIAVYAVTVTIVLSLFGVEIGPILASLGIAGLAVALALQSTLSNFFAGIYILADKPFKVGNFIAVDSEGGVSGFVKEIGWRNTKIQSFANTVFVLPNDKLVNSTIINYSASKDKGRSVVFEVGVDYDSDANKVIKLLKQAVEQSKKKTDAISRDLPVIARFENFGDSALYFKLIFKINEYTQRWGAQSIVKREILDLFRKHKVNVPFPIRTVYLKK